jgi:hypothetical protein
VVPTAKAGEASGVTLAIVIGIAGLGVATAATLIEAISSSGAPKGGAIESILLAVAVGSAALAAVLGMLDRRLFRAAAAPVAD